MEIVLKEIKEISIPPRFRKDCTGGLADLIQSIKDRREVLSQTKGLIHPITVNRLGMLVAGRRRLEAFLRLAQEDNFYNTIPCLYQDQLDELSAREIELEENVIREDFSDEEKVLAMREIHKLKQKKYGASSQGLPGGWSLEDTARAVNMGKSQVGLMVQVAEATDLYPEVQEALRKEGVGAAYKALMRVQASKVTAFISAKLKSLPKETNVDSFLLLGDSRSLIKQIPSGSVNLLFTDPPYGVGVDKMQMFGMDTSGINYDDSPEIVEQLMKDLAPEFYRVLADNAFIFLWTAFPVIGKVSSIFTATGFSMQPLPFFWVKDQAQFHCPNQEQGFAYGVEFAVYGCKGKPVLNKRGQANYIIAKPPLIKNHPHMKPLDLQQELISRFCLEGSKMLDPFAGGGSALISGLRAKMKVLGFELNEDNYNKARIALSKEVESAEPVSS